LEKQTRSPHIDKYVETITKGNFCEEHVKVQKPIIVTDYNWHMGYFDKGDRMANCYSISQRTWKWAKNYFSTSWT